MTREEASIALVLLGLLILAVVFAPQSPGPGPLALVTSAAIVHAALLAPSMARAGGWTWGFLPSLLALPALCATAYGHAGPWSALALLALCCASGAAARSVRSALYLPSMLLVFAMPFALHYVAQEFGDASRATFWRTLSPLSNAGSWPSVPCVLLLLAWPVLAIARRGPR